MHIPWADLQLFLGIAEARSLSAAAKALRVTQPTMSRRLAALESELGEPLFLRSVEGVALTALGERLLPGARRMAETAGELERLASGADSTPNGIVRVTAPPGVAFDFVVPIAAQLRTNLPGVRMEVVATVSYVDLVRREADLALRVQPLDRASSQRDLVCLAELHQPIAAYATSKLAASLPKNYGIADIPWIGWAPPLDQVPPNPQLAARIPGFSPAFSSTDYLVQLRAVEAGLGAMILSRVESERRTPRLVEIAQPFGGFMGSLHLVAAKSSLAIPRVKAVADVLARAVRAVRAVGELPRPARDVRDVKRPAPTRGLT
jgi:DNA-binding transcriptional LysR family regulator